MIHSFISWLGRSPGCGLTVPVLLGAVLLAGCSAVSPDIASMQLKATTEISPSAGEGNRSEEPRPAALTVPVAPPRLVATPAASAPLRPTPGRSASFSAPGYKIGAPYTIGSRTYVPAENPNYDAVGQASWYGGSFHGKPTANGEIFDTNALVAAHPTLPMPCYVYVTNVRNGRTVMLRVNNRGPYAEGRIIDVSHEAAVQLDFAQYGTANVRVRYAGPAPLDGDDTKPRQFLASQPWWRKDQVQRTASVAGDKR